MGVAPGDDVKYLANDYSVYTKSTLDIRHLADLCNYEPGGLGSLSKALLGIVLDKSWRVSCIFKFIIFKQKGIKKISAFN